MKRKNRRKLLFLGWFFRYGIVILTFILPIISFLVCINIDSIKDYTGKISRIFFSIPLILMGIDYILGCILKFDHLILVNQSCKHLEMNPNNLKWDVNKKEFIGIGIMFLTIGLLNLIIAII